MLAHFVLVHGAWHGAWCWRGVVSALEEAGQAASAADLPGVSRERVAMGVTLTDCVDTVVESVSQAHGPVWLVGHSLGGATIALAAERLSDRLAGLVFVAASVPLNGQSHLDALGDDPDSLVSPLIEVDAQLGVATIPASRRQDCFYSDCTPEVVTDALVRFADWQALGPAITPVELSSERFGAVPRHYVECANDRTISLGVQRRLHSASPMKSVVTLRSGHSPFLSMPGELARALVAISAS